MEVKGKFWKYVHRKNLVFSEYRSYNQIVNRLLKNKTICMNCHELYAMKVDKCIKCDCITTLNYEEYVSNLVKAPITKLRIGIPGSNVELHQLGTFGEIKEKIAHTKLGIVMGIKEKNYITYPLPILPEDLEKLFLIGTSIWNIFYSIPCQLGTFTGIIKSSYAILIPIKDEFNKKFTFIGYHKLANKNILILSDEENFEHPLIKDLIKINNSFKRLIDIFSEENEDSLSDFENTEWYLVFDDGNLVFIIPQIISLLDIRSEDDLVKIYDLIKISKEHVKASWKDWDIEELSD